MVTVDGGLLLTNWYQWMVVCCSPIGFSGWWFAALQLMMVDGGLLFINWQQWMVVCCSPIVDPPNGVTLRHCVRFPFWYHNVMLACLLTGSGACQEAGGGAEST